MPPFQEDYKPVPGDWIVARIEFLLEALRRGDRQFAELKPWRFLDPAPVYASVQRADYDSAVAQICAKYGLEADRVTLRWVEDTGSDSVAAHVRTEQFGRVDITIRNTYRRDPPGFGTVLAHELGHAYLADMDIPNGGSWENEATTDLVTFVKGLGKLTVNGVDHMRSSELAGSRCYGYLNREANVFAYARAAQEFNVPQARLKEGLNSAALSYLATLTAAAEPKGGFLGWLFGSSQRTRKAEEMDLTVDEDGNIIERPRP